MCLIALAVPVQGSAAVTMFDCGSDEHHGKVGTASPSAAKNDYAADVLLPSHEAHSVLVQDHHREQASQTAHAQPLEDQTSADQTGEGHCSPCASCCVVAALPSTTVQFQPVSLVDLFVQLEPRDVISFLTESLDRPPRFFLV